MSTVSLTSVKDVREKLLGYRLDSVAEFSGISRDRLIQIEAGAELSVYEGEALARVYGIDADLLTDHPIILAPGDGVGALALLDEFREVTDSTRLAIVAAANAARDLVRLRRLDGVQPTSTELPRLSNLRATFPPHRQGAQHADDLRKVLFPRESRDEPIPSLRDLVSRRFSSVTLLYARMGNRGPAGLALSDHLRGPAIVLNLEGKNENPLVRRFSLAHELYHLLVDQTGREPLALISGYLNEKALDRERRANAFAARFLCPQSKIHSLRRGRAISGEDAVRKLQHFGLPYAAWRLYLHNEADIEIPSYESSEFLEMGTELEWTRAEEPSGVANFPLPEVPPERRTAIARVAARLYSIGKIRRSAFAEALGVTPASDLDRVVSFFALDLPEDGK